MDENSFTFEFVPLSTKTCTVDAILRPPTQMEALGMVLRMLRHYVNWCVEEAEV